MAYVSDFAAGRPGVVTNLHDTGLATREKFVRSAVFRPAIDFAVHPVLSFRPRRDSKLVSLVSSLHAAPLGWNRTIAGNLPRRQEARRVPAMVCQVVRTDALQSAKNLTFPAGISGGGN